MDPHGSHAVRGFRQLKAELVVLQSRVEGEATDRAKLERAPRQTLCASFWLHVGLSFLGFFFGVCLDPVLVLSWFLLSRVIFSIMSFSRVIFPFCHLLILPFPPFFRFGFVWFHFSWGKPPSRLLPDPGPGTLEGPDGTGEETAPGSGAGGV